MNDLHEEEPIEWVDNFFKNASWNDVRENSPTCPERVSIFSKNKDLIYLSSLDSVCYTNDLNRLKVHLDHLKHSFSINKAINRYDKMANIERDYKIIETLILELDESYQLTDKIDN